MANTSDIRLRSVLAGIFGLFWLLVPAVVTAQLEDVDGPLRAATDDGRVAGAVALVVTRDGVVYENAFSKRDVANDVDMTTDSLFRIASMTKPITSVAVMQLVERGLVGLDDPVAKHHNR